MTRASRRTLRLRMQTEHSVEWLGSSGVVYNNRFLVMVKIMIDVS